MKNKKITWIAFAILVLLQLFVPASVIRKYESIRTGGTPFKFRTAPVDPNDYLRGKYVFLDFRENRFEIKGTKKWEDGQAIFVDIGTDSAGFAKIINVHDNEKDAEKQHIKTTVDYVGGGDGYGQYVYIDWPFNRFYMEESKAPLAEKAYNEIRTDSSKISYALVKIKNGDAVLENVFIGNQPITEYINK